MRLPVKVLRGFWNAAELRALAERVLFGGEARRVLQVGGAGLRDMVDWTAEDARSLWHAVRAALPEGPLHGGHVVIRYREGVELKEHRDDGAMRFVALVRAPESGGDLLYEGQLVPLAVGDAVVFDDSKLHEVTRVLAGERWTLTMGIWWR